MQLMTWTLARLGSQFSLVFEPHLRRVRHWALVPTLEQPLDLMVGLVEPDGTQRVLPFTTRGAPLHSPEQFDRLNSITFRGYSPRYRLRFELNIHSVFYPQDERLCIMPAFYLEMRVSPARRVRQIEPVGPTPESITLFIRVARPHAQIRATAHATNAASGQIDLHYRDVFASGVDGPTANDPDTEMVQVHERITSLNPGCRPSDDGSGLTLDLPVTPTGSGIKWRLVWATHCSQYAPSPEGRRADHAARFRYVQHWPDLDAVMEEAVRLRDDRLAHSRRLEKLVEQAPLTMAQRHLLNQSFQTFLANTVWCHLKDGSQWFGVCESGCGCGGCIEVGYHTSMVYLALWPQLLATQLDQWARQQIPHAPSGGAHLDGHRATGVAADRSQSRSASPVEATCQFLLMLQAYAHWTGDLSVARRHLNLVERLAHYVIWSDRDGSGFPAPEHVVTVGDSPYANHESHKRTSLAVERLAALQAAGDLLAREDRHELANRCQHLVERDVDKVEAGAWAGDHYNLCAEPGASGTMESWPGQDVSLTPGCDAYAIQTGYGLLLPAMTAQQTLLDIHRLQTDLANASRESLAAYGCGNSSTDIENIWISKNLWRDHLALYIHSGHPAWHERYWDLQVASNTHDQSLGYCDTYVGNAETFSPRGVVSFGFLLACPRLVIDRLAPGGARISVDPNRHFAKRWPLLPLADWKAGKIPVCVVDPSGQVTIEGPIDPIIVHGGPVTTGGVIG